MVEIPVVIPRLRVKHIKVTPKRITNRVEKFGSQSIHAVEQLPHAIPKHAKKLGNKGIRIAGKAPECAGKKLRAVARFSKRTASPVFNGIKRTARHFQRKAERTLEDID